MKYSAVVTFCYFCAELTLSPFLKGSLKIFTTLQFGCWINEAKNISYFWRLIINCNILLHLNLNAYNFQIKSLLVK